MKMLSFVCNLVGKFPSFEKKIENLQVIFRIILLNNLLGNPALHENLTPDFIQLRIVKPSYEHSCCTTESPNQNLRQISQEVPEL